MPLETILLSNVPHYHHLADALQRAGSLKRHITSITLTSGVSAPGFLPDYWQKKLEGRRISGTPDEKVRQLWLPELLQRGLPMTGLISADRGDWINNHLFDWMAARWIDNCDVFHFVSSVGLYCATKAKKLGALVVCDIRQEHPFFQKKILREEGEQLDVTFTVPGEIYESKVLEEIALSDYLVVPSAYAKESFTKEGYPEEKICIIPYGVDLKLFSPTRLKVPRFCIIFVGQITARKGIQYLLKAISDLNMREIELVLVGGIDPLMKPFLKNYQGVFRHIPQVPKVSLTRFYSEASVFVLPSLADSYGLVVLEAMACGLPVIVTENCGAKEVLSNGKEGFIVPIRDIEALKERILFLYENPDVCEQMGNAAFVRAQQLTWDVYGKRALAFYNQLAQRNQRPVEMLQDVPVG